MAECEESVVSSSDNQKLSGIVNKNECTEENKTDKVSPMLQIADSTAEEIPEFLQLSLQSVVKQQGANFVKHDVLVTLLYVLMLESGFVPKDSVDALEDDSHEFSYKRLFMFSELPKGWKMRTGSGTHYKMLFVLCGFAKHVCQLTCVPSADDLIINAVVSEIPELTVSQFMHPAKYIASSNVNLLTKRLQNLRELSCKFKDDVSNRIKTEILRKNAVEQSMLENVPGEILLKIAAFLDHKSVVRLGECNKYLHGLSKDAHIWKSLLHFDFRDCSVDSSNYISEYITNTATRRAMRRPPVASTYVRYI